MHGIINMCQFFLLVVCGSLVSQPSFVNFESSCCLMLAIDQLRRRQVTNKNNACLSKLLRGLGNRRIQVF